MTDDYTPFANGKIDKKLTNKLEDQFPHLSFGRTADAKDKINPEEMITLLRAIATELITFRNHLRPEHRHSPWSLEITDVSVSLTRWALGAESDKRTTKFMTS